VRRIKENKGVDSREVIKELRKVNIGKEKF